jgi:hypothetical protein
MSNIKKCAKGLFADLKTFHTSVLGIVEWFMNVLFTELTEYSSRCRIFGLFRGCRHGDKESCQRRSNPFPFLFVLRIHEGPFH